MINVAIVEDCSHSTRIHWVYKPAVFRFSNLRNDMELRN